LNHSKYSTIDFLDKPAIGNRFTKNIKSRNNSRSTKLTFIKIFRLKKNREYTRRDEKTGEDTTAHEKTREDTRRDEKKREPRSKVEAMSHGMHDIG
jgi:hypothetical protein